MEHAFRGPWKVSQRLGGFDAAAIAAADPVEFAALCATPPAIHRFPGSMAARLQEVARLVVDRYDGHAERIWTEAKSGADLVARLTALPGFGRQKAQIFTALVAKQLDCRPEGWEQAAGDYALDGHRSVADVTGPESLARVRAHKQERKAAAKAASGALTPP